MWTIIAIIAVVCLSFNVIFFWYAVSLAGRADETMEKIGPKKCAKCDFSYEKNGHLWCRTYNTWCKSAVKYCEWG